MKVEEAIVGDVMEYVAEDVEPGSQNIKVGKVGLTSNLCQNLPKLLIVRTVRALRRCQAQNNLIKVEEAVVDDVFDYVIEDAAMESIWLTLNRP